MVEKTVIILLLSVCCVLFISSLIGGGVYYFYFMEGGGGESGEEIENIFMYGPWIKFNKSYVPVKKIDTIGNNKIYMIEDDSFTKMVLDDGTAKYYKGNINEFDKTKWNTYTSAENNYKLRICPKECTSGCDDKKICKETP